MEPDKTRATIPRKLTFGNIIEHTMMVKQASYDCTVTHKNVVPRSSLYCITCKTLDMGLVILLPTYVSSVSQFPMVYTYDLYSVRSVT